MSEISVYKTSESAIKGGKQSEKNKVLYQLVAHGNRKLSDKIRATLYMAWCKNTIKNETSCLQLDQPALVHLMDADIML